MTVKTTSKTTIKEDDAAPTNSMGDSSSTQGTGPIATYDPILNKPENNKNKRKKVFLKRNNNDR